MIYLKDKQSEPQPSVSCLSWLITVITHSRGSVRAKAGHLLSGLSSWGGGSSSCQQTAVSGVAVWYVVYLLYLKETK